MDEFYKVDLHIHTPASTCYKGTKDDEEYFRILKEKKTVPVLTYHTYCDSSGNRKCHENQDYI